MAAGARGRRTWADDFVELLNRGTTSASLAGRSLQYTSATGSGNLGANASQLTELPDVSLAPGQYLLVQEASNAAVGDPDPATSEGLFVFTSTTPAVAVGDAVVVGGRVTVRSSGNPLPPPTVVGTGGRVPPLQVIEDDATGGVETSGVFDPATDSIDF